MSGDRASLRDGSVSGSRVEPVRVSGSTRTWIKCGIPCASLF